MGFALRKLKNTTPVKRPSKALEYAQKQRRESKPHLHIKDNNFLSRLREIKITEVKEIEHTVQAPEPPTLQAPAEERDTDKSAIPVGMLEIDQITDILANKRRYPEDWTKLYVSETFRIREEHAEGLISYFNNFIEPPAKRLKDPKSTKLVQK